VVQRLFEAYAAGTAEVAEDDLFFAAENVDPAAGPPLPMPFPIEDGVIRYFNDGKHPAWGTLIVAGETEGTYRLAPPPQSVPGAPAGTAVTPDADQTDPAALDRLVDLARQELDVVRAQRRTGEVLESRVREAERTLKEAQLRRAESRGEDQDVGTLLSELVELRRLDFEELKRLEGETVTRSTVLEAERELLKAQLRAQQSSRGPDARDADRMAPDRERDTATLDRLIQLAEEEFAVIQARHEAGEAPKVEVWAAQRKLAEAKFGRAEQRADLDEQRRLLTQIVELRSQELGAAKQRLEGGTVPPNVVREAESALLEAQARLEALQPAGGADRPQPPD
jgi:hypothetical protein